jgi:hypothetical protein
MDKKLFIVETNEQAQFILQNHLNKENYLYIAITPIVMVELKKSNFRVISYNDILPDKYELVLSRERYKILEVIDINCKLTSIFATKTAQHTYKYFLNFIINYNILLIMIINGLKQEFKDYKLCNILTSREFKGNSKTFSFLNMNIDTFITSTDTFVDKILANKLLNKDYSSLKERKNESKVINFFNTLIVKFFSKSKLILTPTIDRKIPQYLNYIRQNNYKYLYIRMSNKEPLKEILYSLSNLMKVCLGKSFNINGFKYDGIITVSGFINKRNISNIQNAISLKKEAFEYDNINFYDAVNDKINNIIIFCNYLDNLYEQTKLVLKNIKKSTLISHASNNFQELVGEIYEKSSNESFMIPHATLLYPDHNIDLFREHVEFDVNYFLDETPYKNIVIQSPLTMEGVKKYKIQKRFFKSQPIVWGTSFDNFDKKESNKDKVILYADTSNTRSSLRPIHFVNIFEYIETMIDLAECIEKMDNVKLIIKIRENEDLTLSCLKFFLSKFKKTCAVFDKSFSYYLQEADIIVSRSSTTIEEALLEDVPVLLYDTSNNNKHIQKAQSIRSDDYIIKNYILYLQDKKYLYSTIIKMLNFNYDIVRNDNTYKDEEIFKIY